MLRFIFALVLFLHSTAFAMPPIMPLSEVQNGMTGTAYTVIDPSGNIQPFNVTIVGTVQNGAGTQPYIMAEASGDLIKRTGGILQGMSGSPVYINGKLVGALSASFKDLSPYTFLITPIESMLDIWNWPDNFNSSNEAPTIKINTDSDTDTTIDTDTDNDNGTANDNGDTELSSFVFSGFDKRSLDFLVDSLGVPSSSQVPMPLFEPSLSFNSNIQAGSPLGVAVVYGDFIVGATGTVTAIDNNRLLAFGHSFTHFGNVNYFLTEAQVVGPVIGPVGGIKVAAVGSIIGRINQDREAGVAGVIGQFPSVVPISVKVNDDNYNAVIAYNETLVPKLGAAIAYSALNRSIDSVTEATVKIAFDIKTNVVESGTFSRENLYYNTADVGQIAVSELLAALTLISSNQTEESNIFGIDVRMSVDSVRKTASLVTAEADKKLVKPGEEVTLKVKIKPYRREEIILEIPYKVPITAPEGKFVLDLYGGGLVPVAQAQQAGVITPSTKSPAELYNEKIQQLLKLNKNNEIIIKPAAVLRTEAQLAAEVKRTKKLAAKLAKLGITPTASGPTKFSTDYVIDNVIQCTLNVDKLD